MNNYKKQAGKSTRVMAGRRRISAIWIAVLGILGIIFVGFFLQNSKAIGISGLGVLGLLILIRISQSLIEGRIDRKLKEEKRAIRGAKAEERVGDILEELSDDFQVLNDIVTPYGNIDHIVISKSGSVFLIETKAHGGRVEVEAGNLYINGQPPEKNFISQILGNTYWLRDQIESLVGTKHWIVPILVFTNAFVVNSPPIKGINIINVKFLMNFINRNMKQYSGVSKIWEQKNLLEEKLS